VIASFEKGRNANTENSEFTEKKFVFYVNSVYCVHSVISVPVFDSCALLQIKRAQIPHSTGGSLDGFT